MRFLSTHTRGNPQKCSGKSSLFVQPISEYEIICTQDTSSSKSTTYNKITPNSPHFVEDDIRTGLLLFLQTNSVRVYIDILEHIIAYHEKTGPRNTTFGIWSSRVTEFSACGSHRTLLTHTPTKRYPQHFRPWPAGSASPSSDAYIFPRLNETICCGRYSFLHVYGVWFPPSQRRKEVWYEWTTVIIPTLHTRPMFNRYISGFFFSIAPFPKNTVHSAGEEVPLLPTIVLDVV